MDTKNSGSGALLVFLLLLLLVPPYVFVSNLLTLRRGRTPDSAADTGFMSDYFNQGTSLRAYWVGLVPAIAAGANLVLIVISS